MDDREVSEAEYWNKQDKEKKPVSLIIIMGTLCLAIAYLISGLGY